MKKVVHIITGLTTGGAEMMLYKLLSISTCNGVVVCLGGDESASIARKIRGLGVKIYFLNMNSFSLNIKGLFKLRNVLRSESPDVIQGWMYHGNIIALLAGVICRGAALLWNVRHSLHDIKNEKFILRHIIRLNALFSNRPDLIIYNSKTSAKQHEKFGFNKSKTKIVPNGFDGRLFEPDATNRECIRKQFSIKDDECLLGLVARFHSMKGHAVFIEAMKNLVSQHSNIKAMLVGKNLDANNKQLVELINKNKLSKHILLLGECDNVPALTSAFDIAVSASLWGEAFSNAIGEAMVAGVPCVVTDVGDSRWIVGEFGKVVKPGDVNVLAKACLELIEMDARERHMLGKQARTRIQNNFGIKAITAQYDNLYKMFC